MVWWRGQSNVIGVVMDYKAHVSVLQQHNMQPLYCRLLFAYYPVYSLCNSYGVVTAVEQAVPAMPYRRVPNTGSD